MTVSQPTFYFHTGLTLSSFSGARFFKEDSLHTFQANLVDSILIKLLWNEYLSTTSAKALDSFTPDKSKTTSDDSSKRRLSEKATGTGYNQVPVSYAQDLGKCIIEILSGIHLLENDLFCAFSVTFQETCMHIFQQKRDPGYAAQVNKFSQLMKQHAMQKGETWPLTGLIGPTMGKFFSLILSTVSNYFIIAIFLFEAPWIAYY